MTMHCRYHFLAESSSTLPWKSQQLTDGTLRLQPAFVGSNQSGTSRLYIFDVFHVDESIGQASILVGHDPDISDLYGQLGLAVPPKIMASETGLRLGRLLCDLAKSAGMEEAQVTCDASNSLAVIKALKQVFATYVGETSVPHYAELFARGVSSVKSFKVDVAAACGRR